MRYLKGVLVGLGLAELATLITTIYLHRVLAHKAIKLHPAVTMFMRLGTWMLTSISPREWVAVHRKHHNFSDVEGDPHSPHIEGYWQIMIGNVYYYRREANEDDHDLRSGRRMREFELPGPQGYEEAVSFANWDVFWYTRGFPSMDTDRSRRHASKLLTYPISIGGAIHQHSNLTLSNQRLTPEGSRSLAGKSSSTYLHLPV